MTYYTVWYSFCTYIGVNILKVIMDKLKLTIHFCERYSERILNKNKVLSKQQVMNSLKRLCTDRQRSNLEFLASRSGEMKIPVGKYIMIVDNKTLITIY